MALEFEKKRLAGLMEKLVPQEGLMDSDGHILGPQAVREIVYRILCGEHGEVLRLQKARIMMVQDCLNASKAAVKVGYESASQFNRAFKRYFGSTTVDEAERMRSMG